MASACLAIKIVSITNIKKPPSAPRRGRPPGATAGDTRERIFRALERRLVEDGSEEGASNRAVARAAGITEMTLYRHFPTRADLLRGFWEWFTQRLGSPGLPATEQELLEWIEPLFAGFGRHAAAARAMLLSTEGLRVRQAVKTRRREAFTAAVAEAGAGLPPTELEEAAAIAQLLHSGLAWLALREFWDFDDATATRAVRRALGALLADLRARPRGRQRA